MWHLFAHLHTIHGHEENGNQGKGTRLGGLKQWDSRNMGTTLGTGNRGTPKGNKTKAKQLCREPSKTVV